MSTTPKPPIKQADVEKAEAIAGFAAGQQARAKGYDPRTVHAAIQVGKETVIGDLRLKPLGIQVQLCLMEHEVLFGELLQEEGMRTGLRRLTHLALIFSDPDLAFGLLTDQTIDELSRRQEFESEAFSFASHFDDAAAIDALSHHIALHMGLLNRPTAIPEPEEATPGKSVKPRRVKASRRK